MMAILTVVILAMLFLVRGDEDNWICENNQWTKQGNPSVPMPTEGCGDVVKEGIVYGDIGEEFGLVLPETWQGYYEVKDIAKDEEGARRVVFNYLVGGENQALLFIINIYGGDQSIASIDNQPNNQIIAQTVENVFTFSQALDMPFEQGTEDFNRYAEMISEVDGIIENIDTNTGVYTLSKIIRENNRDEYWDIEASYPVISGNDDCGTANSLIKTEVEKIILTFKDNMSEWERYDSPDMMNSSLWINYGPRYLSDELVSLRFVIYEYYSSAAHPNTRSFSFSYNLKEQKVLGLGDLFKVSEEEYLNKISELVLVDLKQEFIERDMDIYSDTLETGTEPKIDNFKNFNVSTGGLEFYFDPYHLAAYAAGEFNSLIPYSDLSDILVDNFNID